MEGMSPETQTSSCVDPLWDTFPAEDVTSVTRLYSLDSDETVSKRSTPLTPQEFELMSSSNPFKQDIAEKYGLAYPGITTRSHSRDVYERTALESSDVWNCRGSVQRQEYDFGEADEFTSDYGRRRASGDRNQSVFVALSQFLLRNRQSIDESLKKIDETDDFLSRVNGTRGSSSKSSDLTFADPASENWTVKGKDTLASVSPGSTSDLSGATVKAIDNLEDTSRDKRSSILSDTQDPLRSDTDDLDQKPLRSPQGSHLGKHEQRPHIDRAKSELTKVRSDPYAAIRDEDMQRKRDHAKAYSEGGAATFSMEESMEIPHLFTRSFEVAELSRSADASSHDSPQPRTETPGKYQNNEMEVEGQIVGSSEIQNKELPEAPVTKAVDLFAFDDNLLDTITPLARPTALKRSPAEETLVSKEGTEINQVTQSLSMESYKTVRVQKVDSAELDFVYGGITSPFGEAAVSDLSKDDVQSRDDNNTTGAYQQTKLDSEKRHDQVLRAKNDHFTSSFYTVFSTTVSSLEDAEDREQANDGEDKALESGTSGEERKLSDNAESDSVSGHELDARKFEEDALLSTDTGSDAFNVSELSSTDTSQLQELPDHSQCISKDILLQKQFHISEDSGDSSRGSVSRESMKVNLSQDSSILDQLDDVLISMSATNTQSEPLSHRHFEHVSHLDTLTESTSTDSILVHFSNESLHALGNNKSGILRKPPEKPVRSPLSIEFRKNEIDKRTRRQSLPVVRAKAFDQSLQHIFTASQSVDIDQECPQRRSSLPMETAKGFISSQTSMKSEDELSHFNPFSSEMRELPESKSELKEGTPVLGDLVEIDAASSPNVLARDELAVKDRESAFSKSAVAKTSFASSSTSASGYSTETLVTDSESEKADNIPEANPTKGDIRSAESPTYSQAFTDFIMSRLQKPLVASKASDFRGTSALGKAEPESAPCVLASGSSVSKVCSAGEEDEENIISPTAPLSSIHPSHMAPSEDMGFLEQSKQFSHNVNVIIPPDLVPYEEVYTESLQSLPETSYEQAAVAVEPDLSSAAHADTLATALDESTTKSTDLPRENMDPIEDYKPQQTSVNITQQANLIETREFEVHQADPSNGEVNGSVPSSGATGPCEATLKSESSTDSDGGDIDTIVQEFKQAGSDSDECDIDNIVMEFKKDNPEQDVQSPEDFDDSKQRGLAFTKFGKVLNKMQSVTKYMTKKKAEEGSKDMEEKWRASVSQSGRQRKSYSQDDGAIQESLDVKKDKEESEDAFDLLSKAADVFKEQAVKKKTAGSSKVWRSKTLHTDNIDIDEENEYDLVARAAILFRGFKSKKPGDIDFTLSKPEVGELTDERSEANEGIDLSAPRIEVNTNKNIDSVPDGQFSDTKHVESSNEGSQNIGGGNPLEIYYNEKNAAIVEEVIDPEFVTQDIIEVIDPEFVTQETIEVIESLVKSGDQTDSDISRLEDSGFESVTRHINEQLVRSDATESFCADFIEDIDAVNDYTEIPAVEQENLEASPETIEASETTVIVREIHKELGISDAGHVPGSSQDAEREFPESMTVFQDESGEGQETGQDEQQHETKSSDESTVVKLPYDKTVGDEVTKEFILEKPAANAGDLMAEPSPPAALNEQTCDLILSTRYDEAKVTKKTEAVLTDDKAETGSENSDSQREKTNGRLDQIAQEISTLEAAGLALTTGKQVGSLEVNLPVYQRLSSDSSEGGPDSHSMTVNFPESPDNMKNLEDDTAFSLCCGGNFKIHLNCTAMVKKPERRPSAVVISDKRCAMTEEEKLFPQKMSASYREGLDNSAAMMGTSPPDTDSPKDSARVKVIQDLIVNEHELNRNFAGSREELLEEISLKQKQDAEHKLDSQASYDDKTDNSDDKIPQEEPDSGSPEVAKKEDEEDESEKKKRREKRKSLVEDINTDKETINIYESVLDELMQKQSQDGDQRRAITHGSEGKIIEKSKRFGRVISESDFDENFGQTTERSLKEKDNERSELEEGEPEEETTAEVASESQEANGKVLTRTAPEAAARGGANMLMQQSIDVYDNIMFPDAPPPLPERRHRHLQGYNGETRTRQDPRFANGTRSSLTSVVSDGATDEYSQARRHHAHQRRTKWVSSTPHLSSMEKRDQISSNRTNSYPYLPGSQTEIVVQYPDSNVGSAFSLESDSVCWGNYARVDDIHDRRSYDSESSSGLVIPGAGRESTLSDVSDAYIFGEYATVKDDIQNSKVLRPLDGHNYQRDNAFQFKHFPAALEEPRYQNVSVITVQPASSRYRIIPSNMDVHEDMAPGYAIIGLPMQSKSVQISEPSTPVGVIKVHCASQTSSESLAGLVRNDASDILEGLPVFEYTLGATQSTHSHLADAADSPTVGAYSDSRQPDLTRQTASLDRRKFKQIPDNQSNAFSPKKKATKVTFSRDEVLTEVIDGIKKSERAESNGRGLKDMATSTLSSLGGGVREFAKILYVPFHCCRSGRGEKPKVSSILHLHAGGHSIIYISM